MTQLVTKGSSWRTLRRKAVVGASSIALVAGMGVALAPSAFAADPVPPTITVTAPSPAAVANNGTTASGNFTVKITQPAANAVEVGAGYQLRVTVSVPAGASCVSATNLVSSSPAQSGALTATSAGSCTFTAAFLASGGTNLNVPTAAGTSTYTFTVTLKGTSSTNPPVVGAVKVAAQIDELTGLGGSFVSVLAGPASADAQLVNPGAATFNDTVAQPRFGSVYSAQLVKSNSFPATSNYKVWAYDAANKTFDPVAARTAAATVTAGSNVSKYMSLNDADFAAAPALNDSLTGFFFEIVSGKIVYGTVTTLAAGNWNTSKFVATAVNQRGTSTRVWTVVANDGVNGASGAVAADGAKPALVANDAPSKQFTLNVAFSDVPADSPFADAITALSGANPVVIQGFGDGSFGATRNVTRGEFAAFVYRTLQTIKPPVAPATQTLPYTCNAATPSQFKDVPNNNVFCGAINALASVGVINGKTATTFAPNAKVTRDQAAAFLYRLNSYTLGQQVGDAAPVNTAFKDVTKSNIFSGDIAWGAANGIINGRTATVFAPAANVLRQEAAAFLYRMGNGLYGAF